MSSPAQSPREAQRPRTDGGNRFERLDVQRNEPDGADTAPEPDANAVTSLLPPGFSLENAQGDAVAVTANGSAAAIDRSSLNQRQQLINLGELDPMTGQAGQGFGRGRPNFLLGGRGARGQRPYQGSATYTFGGSALDSAPYQLKRTVAATQPAFAQNTFGATFGGPLKIPRVYGDAGRRTTFQVNYTGNRSDNVFDQYATVPTLAERSGDFSALSIPLFDPVSKQPFAGNRIPASAINATAAALLPFIPVPNIGGSTQNYHTSSIARSASEAVSVRVIQNLSGSVPESSNRAQGGRAVSRRASGPPGPSTFAGTNVTLMTQLQYRRTDTEALNVFPQLGSDTTATTFSAPIVLNVRRGRSIQNVSVTLTHATTSTGNGFAAVNDVAGLAGVQYPPDGATDPLNWGVPNLSFSSGFTGLHLAPASERVDDRLTIGYAWMHPATHHRIRLGGNYRLDRSDASVNANARGTFTFTGLYTSGGVTVPGADFADFLLGFPQQATLQAGGTSRLRQRALAAYVEDNWQIAPKLTFNLGLRYELAQPYTELAGHLANLDVDGNFAAVSPVVAGGTGPYTGAFPPGLLSTDANNLGPRVGVAYRVRPSTILRGGYGITYNSGSYASIARQLAGQPPFAETETVSGSDDAPLTLAQALLSAPASATTNNWGVDRDYALGMMQTWNATLLRNLTPNVFLLAGYTGIKGTDIDMLRAPDLGPGGALIPGTQPFIWESSGGRSRMTGGTFQIRRRLASGYSGGLSYTIARATDDVPSLGTASPVVPQNDRDLAAEWAPSNFDRRHHISADVYVELPWGPNRRWLKNGGPLAAIIGEWSAQFTLTLQSGTPLTARLLGAAADLLRGVNGSLRADYVGGPVQASDPTVDEFFNVAAFAAPAPGEYGDSLRNMIAGPGSRQLNGLFQRDIRLGGTRALTLQLNAANLLNTVQWAAVDTNVNSSTFGQVLAARPMRTMTVSARMRF